MINYKTFRDGDWKFETWDMSRYGRPGFRRYHHHADGWSQVMWSRDGDGNSIQDHYVCSTCSEPIPKRMEGFINLLEWKR